MRCAIRSTVSPKRALVAWPRRVPPAIECLALWAVEGAVKEGAFVFAREFEWEPMTGSKPTLRVEEAGE